MCSSGILMLDVGGTFIKCSDGRTVPVDSDGSREDIVSSLCLALQSPMEYGRVAVAIPGPFDYSAGIFRMDHKFAAVKGESFRSLAAEAWTESETCTASDVCTASVGSPVSVDRLLSVDSPVSVGRPVCGNHTEPVGCGSPVRLPSGDVEFRYMHDVNCMLLGEMTDGNARGYRNVALVSLGTGLGFSVCRDGEILCNESGSPAISIYRMPCRGGILEDYVSKRGFLRGYGQDMTVKKLADMARGGDSRAAERFAETGHILGSGIAEILKDNGTECLLFGGQISRSFDLFAPAVREELSGVSCLSRICTISDFDKAVFKGLQSLWDVSLCKM